MSVVEGATAVGRPLDLTAPMEGIAPKAVRRSDAERGETSSFSFGDFIDIVNPLQHIPGIAELYRSVTNDQISDEARKTGNALYGFALGGPVGLGAMLAYNAVGDRFKGLAQTPESQVAAAAGALDGAPAPAVEKVPEPVRKPAPNGSPVTSAEAKRALLGESVAGTGAADRPAPALAELLGGTGPASTGAAGNASSVAYLDLPAVQATPAPVLPDEKGLDRLAAHEANRLPLDVLKTLQERHAERSASERT